MNYADNQSALVPLTAREQDILHMMADGMTNRQISERLTIGVETVRWYTKQIYGKLGVHSRTQASLRARELGLGTPGRPAANRARAYVPRPIMPVYATPFVGRDRELQDIVSLLSDPNIRLITVAGLGGIGKTRLCVEAVRGLLSRFVDGVYFIQLPSLDDISELAPLVARGMRLSLGTNDNAAEQVVRYLARKQALLVLDGFEHLTGGAGWIARLLQATAAVKVLVTSQASLNLRKEWVRHLDGLPYPSHDDVECIEDYGAVRLFLERAHRVRHDFSLLDNEKYVVEICQLVQGMPLAIELATSWLKTLSCAEIAAEIKQSIDFLAARQPDVDARHRSVRAVFDYAWARLAHEERLVLRRLSVFHGGFGREAAGQVAGASIQVLSELVDKSFLTRGPGELFEMHDLLRQYAEQQLEQTASTELSTRSRMLLTWSSLIKGDFDRAKDLADQILPPSSQTGHIGEETFGLALFAVLAGMEEDYPRCLQLGEASQALLSRHADTADPITLIFANLAVGVGSIGMEDYHSAKAHVSSALTAATALRVPAFMTLCLPVAAIILAHEADTERALELIALASTHAASTPAWMKKWPTLAQLQADLRDELGEEACHELWERGRLLDLDTAVQQLLVDFHNTQQRLR